ncbi:hypothetical protein AB4P91_08880 [Pseudomonas sp. B21128]|uniref:Uncharacterized protein n=1 Tax=Pseudomonas chlororaphis subsp. aurantiaca TaxID=86192 RepID=A0AAJ1E4T4_9PSED|nr:hypothetical protein [Pseudomonas chlororaphis]MBU4636278.1 hypothetical protein [Pseudomonas chlororaphis subsp. aurantiaca]
MTVIALINPETDPHLIADCLISADGEDRRDKQLVWLPSLGLIRTGWQEPKGPWHIVRMGRKTIILPNNGGILAFAGDCKSAFEFWISLSDTINNKHGYNPDARVDSGLIDLVLSGMGVAALKFHMLGVLIDEGGVRRPFIHNSEKIVETSNFGTCYFAGSGTNKLSAAVISEDERHSAISDWPWNKISPTEELVESLCSTMLYFESDARYNINPDTPLSDRFGGFYEWYGVKENGIRFMPTRIDLNLLVENDKLFVTRLHLYEPIQPRDPKKTIFKGQQAVLSVLTFCSKLIEIPVEDLFKDKLEITVKQVDAVLIERMFASYDRPSNIDPRFSGIVPTEVLADSFADPVEIRRVRLVISMNGNGIAKGLTKIDDDFALANIVHQDGNTIITLFEGTTMNVVDLISRHST